MSSYNKVIMLGNITRDLELKHLPSQTVIVEFGLATNRKWTDRDGVSKEDTCFVDVKAFGKTAETINRFFGKGRPILIEGRLDLEQWESKEGGKRSKHVVVVNSFHFVDSKGDSPSAQGSPAVAVPDDEIPF